MNRQNSENSDNRQLGSLAREAEQLRLKQSQAPDSLLLATVAQSAEKAPIVPAEAGEAAGQPPVQEARGLTRPFSFELLLVIALVILASFGDAVGNVRTGIQDTIVDALGINFSPQVYFLNHIDRINADTTNDFSARAKKYEALSAQVKNRFGASDQLTCFVQLSLAIEFIAERRQAKARQVWQEQLQYLNKPRPHPPKAITQKLIELATYYEATDGVAARQLYLAAIKFYPLAPANNTLSNIEQDLATIDLRLGNTAEANDYFKKALAITLSWGNTTFNLHRLREVVQTDISLHNYADAIPYAQKAAKMATIVQPNQATYDQSILETLREIVEREKSPS